MQRSRPRCPWCHAGLGQPEVQGVVALACQRPVDADEVLNAGHLAAQHNLIRPQSDLFCATGRRQH
jgi:hypothetical protein